MAKAEYYVPDDRPWFKYYPEGVPHHLDYPEIPLYQFLDDSAEKYPHKTALVFYGKEITYQELKELSDKFANALQGLGIQKGDRIFFLLPNCPQFVIAFYGTMKAGAIPVPFNPLYSAEELKYFFHDAEPRIVLALDAFYDKVEEAAKVTPQIEKIIVTSIADYFPSFQRTMGKLLGKIPSPQCPNALHFLDFIKESEPKYNPVKIDPKDDVAIIFYTGGTTGKPKGVMLTHFNLVSNTFAFYSWYGRFSTDTRALVLPLFHVYALLLILSEGILEGAECNIIPQFNPKEVIKLIQKNQIKAYYGVAPMYQAFLKYYFQDPKKYILPSLTFCTSGSVTISSALWKDIKKIAPNAVIGEGYGCTEATAVLAGDPMTKNYEKKIGSVGIPISDTDIKIIDSQTKQEILFGEFGEIIVRGPQIFKGYWKKPEKTKEVLKDGWFYTKDIGKIDEEGRLYIQSRLDDMINVRGEKVWPREVEEVLESHPKVREVAVIGVADDYYGQAIKACVVLKEGQEATKEELIEFCKDKLAPHKVPHIIEFFNELPKSHMGRVLYYQLKGANK